MVSGKGEKAEILVALTRLWPSLLQKLAATALWHGAKLEEVPEVSGHPRELLNKVMVAVDRCIARRENPEGRKLSVLDLHSKVGLLGSRFLPSFQLLAGYCCLLSCQGLCTNFCTPQVFHARATPVNACCC